MMTMKKIVWTLLLFLGMGFVQELSAQSPAEEMPREFEMKEGDTTYVMKQYVMVLLYRGESANDFTEQELEELQAGHMANTNRLAEEGKIVVAGPFGDDTELRGIFIMDVATVEEAEELCAADPAIAAGRLRVECHPWWTAKGTVFK